MSTPNVKQSRPQSSGTFGSGQQSGDLPIEWADVEYVQQTAHSLQNSIQQESTKIRQEVKQQVDKLDAKVNKVDAKVDGVAAKLDHLQTTILPMQLASIHARFDDIEKTMNERFTKSSETMDKKFAESSKAMDKKFAESKETMDKKFAESSKATNERFAQVDERFNRLEDEMKSMRDDIRSIMHMLQMQQRGPPRIVEHPPPSHSHDAASGFTRSRYVSDASQSSAAGPSSPRHRQGPSAEAIGDEASLSSSKRGARAHKMFRTIQRAASFGADLFSRDKGKDSAQ